MCQRLIYIFILIITSVPQPLKAQGEGNDRVQTPGQLWNEALMSTRINKKWVAKLDLFWSLSSDKEDKNYIVKHPINYGIRAGAHYFLKPKFRLTPTLGYWYNLEVPAINQKAQWEIRPALDAQVFQVFGRFTLFNRLRYESRFIKEIESNNNNHQLRLRYMPKIFMAINGKVIRERIFYTILSDEIFLIPGDEVLINQNRFTTGLGYCFTNNFTIETTWMKRLSNVKNQPDVINNVISLSCTFNNFLQNFKVNGGKPKNLNAPDLKK
ncbi:MAG: DUF2490 domain-containing protein [Bacteroidetes bacterium]|jgi:hypothetical protein|nr:DUF2490 domain-containing protein [Bacteroidota bacterium]